MSVAKIALIGARGSGKTCFIAGLRWLGAMEESRFISNGANEESKQYLSGIMDALHEGLVPDATDKTKEIEFSEEYTAKNGRRYAFDFKTIDLPGENLREIDSQHEVFARWKESDYLAVFLDVDKDGQFARGQDFSDLFDIIANNELEVENKRLCLVVPKADRHGQTKESCSAENARRFIEEKRPDLIDKIKRLGFKDWKCFYISSLGVQPEIIEEAGRKHGKLPEGHPEPFGYDDLFEWFVKSNERDAWSRLCVKFKMCAFGLLIVGSVIVVICCVWKKHSEAEISKARKDINERIVTPSKQGEAVKKLPPEEQTNAISNKLEEFENKITNASSIDELHKIKENYEEFFGEVLIKASERDKERYDVLVNEAHDKCGKMWIDQIKDVRKTDNLQETRDLIDRAMKDKFVDKNSRKKILRILDDINKDEKDKLKKEIAGLIVQSVGNQSEMERKLRLIDNYQFDNDTDKKEAQDAVEVMREIMAIKTYRMESVQVGEIKQNRRTYLLFASGDDCSEKDLKDKKDSLLRTEYCTGTSPQWDEFTHKEFGWKPGDRIIVEWRWNAWCGFGDTILARKEFNGDWLTILRLLAGRVGLDDCGIRWRCTMVDGPWLKLKCKELPDAEKALPLIEKYILPGHYWNENE